MARRKGKVYSSPKGYKASLTPADGGRRRDRPRANAWGSSRVPPGYKPGDSAPRFPGFKPTETAEDMDARRGAVDRWFGQSSKDGSVGMPPASDLAEVLSAVKSHGTVEASQYGEYSGRTVRAPSTGRKLGESGLTDVQKSGVERSVAAEIDSRLEAKRTGAAYTGARSAEEQRWQNLDYQNNLISGLTRTLGSEEKAREEARGRLGDRWVEPPSTGLAAQPDGPVTREFAPGVGGYTVSARREVPSAETRPVRTHELADPLKPEPSAGQTGRKTWAEKHLGQDDRDTLAQPAAIVGARDLLESSRRFREASQASREETLKSLSPEARARFEAKQAARAHQRDQQALTDTQLAEAEKSAADVAAEIDRETLAEAEKSAADVAAEIDRETLTTEEEKSGVQFEQEAGEHKAEDIDRRSPRRDDEETAADAKGGESGTPSQAPAPSVPVSVPPAPTPVQAAPGPFGSPYEAAAAISAAPDMDYADLVSAAYAVASPTSAGGGNYDPEAVFRGVLAPRIESDLLAGIASMRALEDEASARYHGANSQAVMQACGATETEYRLASDMALAGDPSELLRMQMKFMDSF